MREHFVLNSIEKLTFNAMSPITHRQIDRSFPPQPADRNFTMRSFASTVSPTAALTSATTPATCA